MSYKLLTNFKDCFKKLRRYFSFYLRGKILYQHINRNTNQLIFESTLKFHNLDTFQSIYFFKHEGMFYFGLGREIYDLVNISSLTKISSSLHYKLKVKDAIMFAEEGSKIFFIMPIDLKSLTDKEVCSLKKKHDIINIDNKLYINFGELKRGIHILKNLRNFMFNVDVDMDEISYLKLNKVKVLREYVDDERFCQICDNLISKSYLEKSEITRFSDKICADCISKRLMDYFLVNSPNSYKKKENLEILSKKYSKIRFYLDLFKEYELFNDDGVLPNNLGEYLFEPKDKKLRLDTSNARKFQKTIDLIDDIITFEDNIDKISHFEELLFINNLSVHDGVIIKEELEKDVFSGLIKFTNNERILKINIESRINERIKMMSHTKNSINLFNIITEVNKITLTSNGVLNNNFLEDLNFCSDNECVCWEIRDNLISKIDKGLISSENQIRDIMDNLIWEKKKEVLIKKECYCLGENVHIRAVLTSEELLKFIESLNSFKKHILLDIINIFNLNNDLFMIKMDFQVISDTYDVFGTILSRHHFDKFLLKHESTGD